MHTHVLNQKSIRKQPGLSERQYTLFEHLGTYIHTILRHYDIHPTRLERLGYGTKSAVVAVYHDEPWVLKISAQEDLESETFFLENAHLHNIPVPRILMSDFTRKIIPFDFIFLSFVHGQPPHVFRKDARLRAGIIFGKYLARIHRIHVDGVGNIRSHVFAHPQHAWRYLLRTSLRRKFDALISPPTSLQQSFFFVSHLLSDHLLTSFTPRLLHGDAGGNNYLIHRDTRNRVYKITFIDPGTWVGGDPMQDLAFTQISWNYPGFAEGVLRGYKRVHKLTQQEQSRFETLRLFNQYWACLVSFSRGRMRWKQMLRVFHALKKNVTHPSLIC